MKSVLLKNFQVHRRLLVEFSPGITTVKGPTDAGKSAILRALRWLCLNDRTGDSFISRGAAESIVVLRLQSGGKVVRKRGRSNIYKMDGKVLKSFGLGVPEPVANALAVCEINFQRQHDSPFWLSESAPEISRQLNRVVDLSSIDSSLAVMGRMTRTAKERAAVSEERLREKRAELKGLLPQRRRIKAFQILKERQEELESMSRTAEALCALLRSAEEWKEKAKPVPSFSGIESLWDNLEKMEKVKSQVEDLLARIDTMESTAKRREAYATALREKIEAYACPLCGRINK